MPFSFYLSKPALNNFALKEQDIPANLLKNTDYFVLVHALGVHYFSTIFNTYESLMLLEYLKEIMMIENEFLILENIAEIQKRYRELLKSEHLEALIEVMLVARNVVLKQAQVIEYDTEASQVENMRLVQKRLMVLSQVLGMFSDDFYEHKDFVIHRVAFLLALSEDACSQLKNIGHGLYYTEYTKNFEDLIKWFGVNWNATASIFARLSQRARDIGIPQSELQRLLPVFVLAMDRVRYAAAYSFANGDNQRGETLLKESKEYNIEMQNVFRSAYEQGAGLLQYQSILQRHADNLEGFGLDTPLNQYRRWCIRILTAINTSSLFCEHKLCEKEERKSISILEKASKIDEPTCLILEKGIKLLQDMALLQYSQSKQMKLEYLAFAKHIVGKLSDFFEAQKSNAILIQAQDSLLKYTQKMGACVDEIQAKSNEKQKKFEDFKKIIVQASQSPPVLPSVPEMKTKSKKNAPSYQSEEEQQKLTDASQNLKKTMAALESAKKDLLKASNQYKSATEKLRGQKRKQQKFEDQIALLRQNIELAKEKNMALQKEIDTAAQPLVEYSEKESVISLEAQIEAQASRHQQEIESLTREYETSCEYRKKESEIAQIQAQLSALQLKMPADAQKYHQQSTQLETQHTVEREKREQTAQNTLESLQAQKKLTQDKLKALRAEIDKQGIEHTNTLEKLKAENPQKRVEQKPFLLKKPQDMNECPALQQQNKALLLELEALEKAHLEQNQQYQQQYQLACSNQAVQKQVWRTVMQTLEAALEQKKKQLGGSEVCIRISNSSIFEFSTNLVEKLHKEPALIAECLSVYLQLNKPICEKDFRLLYDSIGQLLLSKEIKPYLAIFSVSVSHIIPLYGFKKLYYDNIFGQLIPLAWPKNPRIIQDWLKFVEIRLNTMPFPMDPYYMLNLILIPPYYALAQHMLPKTHTIEIVQQIANGLVQALPNIEDSDKILLKRHIDVGLYETVNAFQIWITQERSQTASVLSLNPAPILPSITSLPMYMAEPLKALHNKGKSEKKRP